MLGSDYRPVISEHADEIKERTQSYGEHAKPEDYLDSFNQFIKDQLNQSVALAVVINKPRDLSREQLKEIKLLLMELVTTEQNCKAPCVAKPIKTLPPV